MLLSSTELYRDFGTPQMPEPMYVLSRLPEPGFSEIVGMARLEDGDFVVALAHGESKILEPHEGLEVFTESQAQLKVRDLGQLVKKVCPKRHELGRQNGLVLVFA